MLLSHQLPGYRPGVRLDNIHGFNQSTYAAEIPIRERRAFQQALLAISVVALTDTDVARDCIP
jgi:hypothetical protein